MDLNSYVIAGYDSDGEEIARWTLDASDPADACATVERKISARDLQAHGGRVVSPADVDEYQAILRLMPDDEIIRAHYTQTPVRTVCTNCGADGTGHYVNVDTDADSTQCLPCVKAGLAHGRVHVSESFEEELLPVCGYCVTVGHRAFDCPERPTE